MTVVFHPDFAGDIRRFAGKYGEISAALALRFRNEIDAAIDHIIAAPGAAGHFLRVTPGTATAMRRRNLPSFPFFVLYGATADRLYFASVIPSRSDPLLWLTRNPIG